MSARAEDLEEAPAACEVPSLCEVWAVAVPLGWTGIRIFCRGIARTRPGSLSRPHHATATVSEALASCTRKLTTCVRHPS